MNKFTTIVVASAGVLLSLPVSGQMGMMRDGHMNMSMKRHHFVMMNGIDKKYANKENPLEENAENALLGKKLYEQNCASCHGVTGVGDGEAGKSLNPRPANIATFSRMPMATDSYLYWTIAEGGAPIGTAMPPFRETLKEEDIWKIITYLRTL